MKKTMALLLLCGTLLLSGCDPAEMSTLRDISRPYAAEYACKKLLLGGEDLLGRFEFLKLDLGGDGSFRVFYEAKDGNAGEYGGGYEIDEEAQSITLTAPAAGGRTYRFPYEKGTVRIELLLAGKLLYAEFSAVG